jgi:hypothetical protein
MTRLPQHGDVSLAVLFEHASVIEYFRFLRLVPLQESASIRIAHGVGSVITDVSNRAYIIHVFLGVEEVRVP